MSIIRNKWIKIDPLDLLTVVMAAFFMFLLWNILVINHRKDIERDKYYIDNCKVTDDSYSTGKKCDNSESAKAL